MADMYVRPRGSARTSLMTSSSSSLELGSTVVSRSTAFRSRVGRCDRQATRCKRSSASGGTGAQPVQSGCAAAGCGE
eukprot:1630024-Pleurochrysis_carterae.AAC.3